MAKSPLDPARSRIRIRAFAEGFLSRLAHDLELDCSDLRGELEHGSEGASRATLEVPLERISVAGTLKGGRLDPAGLSSADKADCLAKMRKEVFHTEAGSVRVEATVEGDRAHLRVLPPNGRSVARDVRLARVQNESTVASATGRVELSLSELGSDVVRGPMNAFRIKDVVEVHFDVVFAGGGP